MTHPDEILGFWLEDCEPTDWYRSTPKLDDTIRDRFGETLSAAAAGALRHWTLTARSTLALVILTDQMSRNMFRDKAEAFATDRIAKSAVHGAIIRGFDLKTPEPARQFFYLPLEHSESLQDQSRAVRLIMMRTTTQDTLLHARAHRRVIRRYGRFPFRNAALGRASSQAEQRFLDGGGYGAVVREVQAEG